MLRLRILRSRGIPLLVSRDYSTKIHVRHTRNPRTTAYYAALNSDPVVCKFRDTASAGEFQQIVNEWLAYEGLSQRQAKMAEKAAAGSASAESGNPADSAADSAPWKSKIAENLANSPPPAYQNAYSRIHESADYSAYVGEINPDADSSVPHSVRSLLLGDPAESEPPAEPVAPKHPYQPIATRDLPPSSPVPLSAVLPYRVRTAVSHQPHSVVLTALRTQLTRENFRAAQITLHYLIERAYDDPQLYESLQQLLIKVAPKYHTKRLDSLFSQLMYATRLFDTRKTILPFLLSTAVRHGMDVPNELSNAEYYSHLPEDYLEGVLLEGDTGPLVYGQRYVSEETRKRWEKMILKNRELTQQKHLLTQLKRKKDSSKTQAQVTMARLAKPDENSLLTKEQLMADRYDEVSEHKILLGQFRHVMKLGYLPASKNLNGMFHTRPQDYLIMLDTYPELLPLVSAYIKLFSQEIVATKAVENRPYLWGKVFLRLSQDEPLEWYVQHEVLLRPLSAKFWSEVLTRDGSPTLKQISQHLKHVPPAEAVWIETTLMTNDLSAANALVSAMLDEGYSATEEIGQHLVQLFTTNMDPKEALNVVDDLHNKYGKYISLHKTFFNHWCRTRDSRAVVNMLQVLESRDQLNEPLLKDAYRTLLKVGDFKEAIKVLEKFTLVLRDESRDPVGLSFVSRVSREEQRRLNRAVALQKQAESHRGVPRSREKQMSRDKRARQIYLKTGGRFGYWATDRSFRRQRRRKYVNGLRSRARKLEKMEEKSRDYSPTLTKISEPKTKLIYDTTPSAGFVRSAIMVREAIRRKKRWRSAEERFADSDWKKASEALIQARDARRKISQEKQFWKRWRRTKDLSKRAELLNKRSQWLQPQRRLASQEQAAWPSGQFARESHVDRNRLLKKSILSQPEKKNVPYSADESAFSHQLTSDFFSAALYRGRASVFPSSATDPEESFMTPGLRYSTHVSKFAAYISNFNEPDVDGNLNRLPVHVILRYVNELHKRGYYATPGWYTYNLEMMHTALTQKEVDILVSGLVRLFKMDKCVSRDFERDFADLIKAGEELTLAINKRRKSLGKGLVAESSVIMSSASPTLTNLPPPQYSHVFNSRYFQFETVKWGAIKMPKDPGSGVRLLSMLSKDFGAHIRPHVITDAIEHVAAKLYLSTPKSYRRLRSQTPYDMEGFVQACEKEWR